MLTISNRRIGAITLDVTTSEEHESTLRITDNPIESGAVISDHAVVEPKQINIEGIVVDYEPSNGFASSQSNLAVRGTPDFVDNISFNGLLNKAFTAITQFKMTNIANTWNYTKADNIRPLGNQNNSSGYDLSTSNNARISTIQQELERIQGSGETIEINTGTKLYKNMLLPLVSVTQTLDGSATVRVNAREIIIVETQSISGLSGLLQSGRTAIQTAAKVVKGEVNTQDAPNKESLIKTALGFGL
ncbi:phage baseplate protein [Entomomonas asaccharolytica]|uniref:Dit-like phage tail protein N-terminal domain-containing protein n=1 Tax=Entomomonas asaccharolytica TaxID=2785331 RepID=A0A974RY88_9GAMM|nr:hypothetical protein [Entomomonas asaccharolytica]QQP86947.1 hypothetical protein JHT90_06795 [Entomomonas asaccharolytica]